MKQYRSTLEKGARLTIPSEIRDHFDSEETIYMLGIDKKIVLMNENEFRDVERRFMEIPYSLEERRAMERLFYSNLFCTRVGKGKIVLPPYLRRRLDGRAVVFSYKKYGMEIVSSDI